MLLPSVGPGDHYGYAINDDGDITGKRVDGAASEATFYRWDADAQVYFGFGLGVYGVYATHLNNPGALGEVQIVTRTGGSGTGYRVTLWPDLVITPGDIEEFDRYDIWRINDVGTFCGHREGLGKGKNREPEVAFRWSGAANEPLDVLREGFDFGTDVNSAGDVSILYGALYTDEDGVLELTDLVSEFTNYTPYGINDRDATGFPQICGAGRKFIGDPMQKYQNTAMVLTPKVSE